MHLHVYACGRAHVQMHPTHDLCDMHRHLVYNNIPNLVLIGQGIPELELSDPF